MIKIAIVGSGWVGCHLAKHFTNFANVTLFDKSGIFTGASSHNQNRLHLGFHYARNYQTRDLCRKTFSEFEKEYAFLVKPVQRNIYAIPKNTSILDSHSYLTIFDRDNIEYRKAKCSDLIWIEESIETSEKLIDHQLAREYFLSLHKDKLVTENITDFAELLSDFDFVINCSNNLIKEQSIDSYHEVSLSLLYRKIKDTDFGALTLVDGNFFSIFPYSDDLYTLTSVKLTPMYLSDSPKEVIEFKEKISNEDVLLALPKFVNEVVQYYPNFLLDFEYAGYYTSIKAKTYNQSANRSPIIVANDRLINCFTGKIQGIFEIEKTVKKYIISHERFNR